MVGAYNGPFDCFNDIIFGDAATSSEHITMYRAFLLWLMWRQILLQIQVQRWKWTQSVYHSCELAAICTGFGRLWKTKFGDCVWNNQLFVYDQEQNLNFSLSTILGTICFRNTFYKKKFYSYFPIWIQATKTQMTDNYLLKYIS